ncbi:steroid receptor RNA activator 1-like isoform X2 [Tachypleus tridentatus]|uniref:steroid receptor RNA activator 1-like isoform X2 n=1 Tax=Tachypleus tridentatus TaxID=6853 RepID=UPI003FD5C05E
MAASSSTTVTSSSRSGNQDRAWNDPPICDFNQTVHTAPSKRTPLNKRISYPQDVRTVPTTSLNHSPMGLGESTNSIMLLPPLSDTAVPHTCPTIPVPLIDAVMSVKPSSASVEPSNPNSETCDTKDNGREECTVEETFPLSISFLEEIFQKCMAVMKKRTSDDVRLRLELLSSEWRGNKLSDEVKRRTYLLAKGLKEEDFQLAHKIHLSLMVDHVREVNTMYQYYKTSLFNIEKQNVSHWMVGVKHLIHEAQKVFANTEGNREEISLEEQEAKPVEQLKSKEENVVEQPKSEEENVVEQPKSEEENVVEQPKSEEENVVEQPKSEEENVVEQPKS